MAWDDEFLSHLRRVHFTLIGTSFALIVAGTLTPSGVLQEASRQGRMIMSIRQEVLSPRYMDPISETLAVDFVVKDSEYHPLGRSQRLSREVSEGLIFQAASGDVRIGSHSWDRAVRSKGNLWPELFIDEAGLLRPRTLARFAKAWDFFAKGKALTVSDVRWQDIRVVASDGNIVDGRKGVVLRARAAPEFGSRFERARLVDGVLSLREERDEKRTFAPSRWFVVVELKNAGDLGLTTQEVHVPVEARKRYDIDFQAAILPFERFSGERGAFGDAFGELIAVTKGLETLELEPLLTFVRQQAREADERIQLLGIQVPRSVISQWGFVILVACQGYFLLHLRRCAQMQFPDGALTRFPWITLYEDLPARLVSAASVTIVPLAAAVALATSGWSDSRSMGVRLSLLTGVGGVALLSLLGLWWLRSVTALRKFQGSLRAPP